MYVAFWVRVALALGTSEFNIKIVRSPAMDPVASEPRQTGADRPG
jgi:hypothetical protein